MFEISKIYHTTLSEDIYTVLGDGTLEELEVLLDDFDDSVYAYIKNYKNWENERFFKAVLEDDRFHVELVDIPVDFLINHEYIQKRLKIDLVKEPFDSIQFFK